MQFTTADTRPTTGVMWPDPTYSIEQADMYDFAGIPNLTRGAARDLAAAYLRAIEAIEETDSDFLIGSQFGSRWATDWGMEFVNRLLAYGLPDQQTQTD